MLKKIISEILANIMRTSFPHINIEKFNIALEPIENEYFNDSYFEISKTIRIINLSRKLSLIIFTSMHQLAHHINISLNDDTKHSENFYGIYLKLIDTMINEGMIYYEDIEDDWDVQKAEKKAGKISGIYGSLKSDYKNLFIIKISNCYNERNLLKKTGYEYDNLEQKWIKEIYRDVILHEKEYLKTFVPDEYVEICGIMDMTMDPFIYLTLSNVYSIKDIIVKHKYCYKKYKTEGKVWGKKIRASKLKDEREFLSQFDNIKIKISANA